MIFITFSGTHAFSALDGFDIPPGFATTIGVTGKKVILLPEPYGKCASTNREAIRLAHDVGKLPDFSYNNLIQEKKYTSNVCYSTCLQRLIFKTCNCFDIQQVYAYSGAAPLCGHIKNKTLNFSNKDLETCIDKEYNPAHCQAQGHNTTADGQEDGQPSDEEVEDGSEIDDEPQGPESHGDDEGMQDQDEGQEDDQGEDQDQNSDDMQENDQNQNRTECEDQDEAFAYWEMMKLANCFLPYSQSINHLLDDLKCVQDVKDRFLVEKDILCDCQPACEDMNYDLTLGQSIWPAQGLETTEISELLTLPGNKLTKYFNASVHADTAEIINDYLFKNDIEGMEEEESIRDTEIMKNFARVTIYARSLSVQQTEQIPAYTMTQLISDIGKHILHMIYFIS